MDLETARALLAEVAPHDLSGPAQEALAIVLAEQPAVVTEGVVDLSGCTCVTCVTSRANRTQAERIKALTATIARVRELCAKPGYIAAEEITEALDGPSPEPGGQGVVKSAASR